MKVVIAMMQHETNTFSLLPTNLDGFNDPRYQDALSELGENKEDIVVRNLVIIEAP